MTPVPFDRAGLKGASGYGHPDVGTRSPSHGQATPAPDLSLAAIAQRTSLGQASVQQPRSGAGLAACGVERWAVKTLTDRDADEVDFTAKRTTVDRLRLLLRPAHLGARVPPVSALTRACGRASASSFTYLRGRAMITGVGPFDFKHGQTGVAPNAIELHPVIGFDLVSATCTRTAG
jgi:hypothetical protein